MEFVWALGIVVVLGLPLTISYELMYQRIHRARTERRIPRYVREQHAPPSVARTNPQLAELIEHTYAHRPYRMVRRG